MYDVAPLVEGRLLLSSFQHFSCAATVQEELFSELDYMKKKAQDFVEERYGSVCLFEHGRVGSCVPHAFDVRSCHHFHLHVLPFTCSIKSALQGRFEEIDLQEYRKLINSYEKYGEYLFYEEDGKGFFYIVDEDIEPHLLRTLYARLHHIEERANWLSYTSEELLEQSLLVSS